MRSIVYVAPPLLRCVTRNNVSSTAEYVTAGAEQKCVPAACVNSVPLPVPVRASG